LGSLVTHIRVRWSHDHPDEPVLLYSELDGERWEVRKVEIFRDGSQGYADTIENDGRSLLSEEPIPSLDDIAADPQFQPQTISAEAFEAIWNGRKGSIAAPTS
jgi:ABC-type nitrate/sulfonate/bicarbonate transport system substrate-binding protein